MQFVLESGNVVAEIIGDTMILICLFEDVSNQMYNKSMFDQVKLFITSFKSVENVQKRLIEVELGLNDFVTGINGADWSSLKLTDMKKISIEKQFDFLRMIYLKD